MASLDDDLDALLVERVADARPGIEFSEQFKDLFRREVEQRRQQSRCAEAHPTRLIEVNENRRRTWNIE